MHIKNVIIVANTLFFITCGAMAADTMQWEHMACSSLGINQTVFCYDNNKYIQYAHCQSCPSGTTETQFSVCSNPSTYVNSCTPENGGSGSTTVTPGVLVKVCSLRTDSECDSCTDTDWAAVGTTIALAPYQKRTVSTCTSDTDCKCEYSTEYRCAANYYGSVSCAIKQSTGITCSGCTKCPSQDGLIGYAVAGTTTITGCYVMPGLPATTSDGDKYQLNQNCYHSGS